METSEEEERVSAMLSDEVIPDICFAKYFVW